MELPPDPDSLEMWQKLPQNQPSKQALPPATGGTQMAMRMGLAFLLILSAVIIIGLFLQRGPA
jgi:hypothetical protein